MADAAHSPANAPDAESLVAELSEAHDVLERTRRRVDAVGERELATLRDSHAELTGLFDRYEEQVTGDGNFQTFIEFQGKIAEFTEELLDDLRHRDVFEDVDDLLQQRRLTESDWARVRETLAPVREDVERLDDRDEARERYRDTRHAVERRRGDLTDRIDDLERLQRLGDADLDAPTERLRDPIERYNDRVADAFDRFTSDAGTRTVLAFLDATEQYPLVDFRSPPEDLREYVATHEPGAEPIPQLLEYSEYSRSKLDHYVGDADALKRNVATHRTFFRRLDAEPLTVSWPPPSPETLRYRARELESVVARFVDAVDLDDERDGPVNADPLVSLRQVRALPRETDYAHLRESAQARAQLGSDERDRLASGAVASELADCRMARDRLDEALSTYPSL